MFLTDKEVAILTGRKMKGRQIEALRQMGVPFRINATGHAIVTCAAIEGRKEEAVARPAWTPRVLKAG